MAQPTIKEAKTLLWFHWGYESFRPGQEEAISAVLSSRDVLAVLPTGGGKSVTYQIPAMLMGGVTLVVTPLVALMRDQVSVLKSRGINATALNSSLSNYELDQRYNDVEHGRYPLLFVSPERLHTRVFKARAHRLNISVVVVDEAHCISMWGHDFRPAYRKICTVYPLIGRPPVMAVTATANPAVRRDIVTNLALVDPRVVVKGFDRSNILWSASETYGKKKALAHLARDISGSGIVYVSTRRAAEDWAAWLSSSGVAAAPYHAGLAAAVRNDAQLRWMRGELRFLAATGAFGMGIDKPDVRLVVHLQLPSTLEAYYQEAGRAGRDGHPAYAAVMYSQEDFSWLQSRIVEDFPTKARIVAVYQAICNYAHVSIGEKPTKPLVSNLHAITRSTGLERRVVWQAIRLLEESGVWTRLSFPRGTVLLNVAWSPDQLARYAQEVSNRSLGHLVVRLIRNIPREAFGGWQAVQVQQLSGRVGLSEARLRAGLGFFAERGMLRWISADKTCLLCLNQPRTVRVPVDASLLSERRQGALDRLAEVVRYVETTSCRRHLLLSYLGEEAPGTCARCDNCVGSQESPIDR